MKESFTQKKQRIVIIGAGYVGASIAYALMLNNIGSEIVLIDKEIEKARGEALDIRNAVFNMGMVDVRAGEYSECKDCDLIIIAAGRNRKKGESRLNMINDNVEVVRKVVGEIKKYYTTGIILVVSNPVDILTYKVDEWMELPRGKVLGTGCMLDSSRFVRNIADYFELNPNLISGYVIGEHGENQVPVWSCVKVKGIPIDEYCESNYLKWNEDIKNKIAEKTKYAGEEIIKTKGKTHYGIATCVCCLANAIVNRKQVVASITSPIYDESGVRGVALSVPCIVGPMGIEQYKRENWDVEEGVKFLDTVEKVKNILKWINE